MTPKGVTQGETNWGLQLSDRFFDAHGSMSLYVRAKVSFQYWNAQHWQLNSTRLVPAGAEQSAFLLRTYTQATN